MKRLWEILSAISLVAGMLCLFLTPLPAQGFFSFYNHGGLGRGAIALAGLIAIVTAVASSKVIEESLKLNSANRRPTCATPSAPSKEQAKKSKRALLGKLNRRLQELRSSISDLRVATTYLNRSKELGVVMVYENRSHALEPFNAPSGRGRAAGRERRTGVCWIITQGRHRG